MSRQTGLRRGRIALVATAVLVAAIIGVVASSAAHAEAETYRIDPEHTTIGFRVSHLLFSKVFGRFNTFEGGITVDPSDLTKGDVTVSIDAASIDTNQPARDKHLRSDAFFDIEKYPKITFRSTRVKKVGDKKTPDPRELHDARHHPAGDSGR